MSNTREQYKIVKMAVIKSKQDICKTYIEALTKVLDETADVGLTYEMLRALKAGQEHCHINMLEEVWDNYDTAHKLLSELLERNGEYA